MKRPGGAAVLAVLLAASVAFVAGAGAQEAGAQEAGRAGEAASPPAGTAPAVRQPEAPQAGAPQTGAPQARRPAPQLRAPARAAQAAPAGEPRPADGAAVLGVLDKRLGTTAEYVLKPGERFSFGRLSGVMRSCERTQPFERVQSAAFVQVTDQRPVLQGQAAQPAAPVFSGWLFAESPSLNPFVHPVYDVWLKSCTMRLPDGPPAKESAGSRSSPPASRSPGSRVGSTAGGGPA